MKAVIQITRKIYIISITLLLFSINANAEIDTISVSSDISEVTVFLRGAQVTRTSLFNLQSGKHVLLFESITTLLDQSSIKVKAPANCEVLSVKFEEQSVGASKKSEKKGRTQDQIDSLKLEVKKLKMQLSVYSEEKTLLIQNKNIQSKSGSQIDELAKATAFYREKLTELNGLSISIDEQISEINKKSKKLHALLNDIKQSKMRLPGKLIVMINCLRAGSSRLEFTYYTEAAGWDPVYDFKVKDIAKPLQLVYNGNVFQSTKEDWKEVSIILSSVNPKMGNEIPQFSTWYLSRLNRITPKQIAYDGAGAIKGTVILKTTDEPVPFANVIVEKNGMQIGGAQTDFDGNYTIKPLDPGSYNLKATFVGYETAMITAIPVSNNKITYQNLLMKKGSVDLAEVSIMDYSIPLIDKGNSSTQTTITANDIRHSPNRNVSSIVSSTSGSFHYNDGDEVNVRGGRTNSTDYYVDGIKVRRSLFEPTGKYLAKILQSIEKENKHGLEYKIDEPYTILSDGKNYLIEVIKNDVNVKYTYHAIPKLDQDVFLVAEFSNWRDLDLLSGNFNMYYNGTYLGESKVDAKQLVDTLELSIARDREIQVKRESKKDLNDKKVFGSNVKESLVFEITVKNNKNTKVSIVLKDQIPVSEYKSVFVELGELANAKHEDNTGILTWEFELEPNETKVIRYDYSIKYPKALSYNAY